MLKETLVIPITLGRVRDLPRRSETRPSCFRAWKSKTLAGNREPHGLPLCSPARSNLVMARIIKIRENLAQVKVFTEAAGIVSANLTHAQFSVTLFIILPTRTTAPTPGLRLQ